MLVDIASLFTSVRRLRNILGIVFLAFPRVCICIFVLNIILGLLPIAGLSVGKMLLDCVVALCSGAAPYSFSTLWVVLTLGALIGIIASCCSSLESFLSEKLQRRIQQYLQERILRWCSVLDYSYCESIEGQNILGRTQAFSSSASFGVFCSTVRFLRCITGIVSAAILLFFSSFILAVVALLVAIPVFVMQSRFSLRQYHIQKMRTERDREMSYYASALVGPSQVRDCQLFSLTEFFLDRWRHFSNLSRSEDISVAFSRSKMDFLIDVFNQVVQKAVYAFVVFRTLYRHGTVGDVAMITGLFINVSSQFYTLSMILANYYRDCILLSDFFDVEKMVAANRSPEEGISLEGPIELLAFRNVSFRYPNLQRLVLDNVSFELRAPDCVCLVGPNGAGKSTIVKLILRLYEPVSGSISINGRDIREYSLSSLRKRIGVLMQDYNIYSSTVKENIICGDLTKAQDQQKFWRAVKNAGLTEMIRKLPKQEHTTIGKSFHDREELSIGERQKLALARIFFRNADMCILDEPTSSLDSLTEERIMDSYRRLSRGNLAMMVSHRFSSALIADKCLLIAAGKIAGIGTHLELLESSSIYADLFHSQHRQYFPDADGKRKERVIFDNR